MAATIITHLDGVFNRRDDAHESDAAPPTPTLYTRDHADLDRFIDREIEVRMAKHVSWSKLDTCFKWSRIQEYFKEHDVAADAPLFIEVRGLLRSNNKLHHVSYDPVCRKVVKLNMGEL